MTSRLSIFLLAPTFLLSAGPGHADDSDFSSFDECILESLKGVSSDVAANAIIASCRNTFPETAPVAAPPAAESPTAESAPVAESPPAEASTSNAEPAVALAGASRELTAEELSKLKATLMGFATQYRVTFENLNDGITITEATIAVWDDLDPRGLKTYTEAVRIPPSETAKITYEVVYMGDDQGWRWKVDSARGVPLVH